MKVVFLNSHILWPSHYETELELIENHILNGDTVIQYYCDAQLPNCDLNPFFVPSVCDICINKRKQGYSLLSGKIDKRPLPHLLPDEMKRIRMLPDSFSSVENLQELEIDGFDIGYAVASSLISTLRDPKPDLQKYRVAIADYITGSAAIYLAFKRIFVTDRPDRVYVFNGRLAHVKPMLRLCQQTGIECFVHERGADKAKYSISVNSSPHEISYVQEQMKKVWDNADCESRVKIASEFYLKRKAGQETGWYSFIKGQKDIMPEGWSTQKVNIAVFNSSEDEFASLSKEWKNDLYSSQIDGLTRILADLKPEDNIHFYLRIHPNLRNVDNEDTRKLYKLKSPFLTTIPADSPISTYLLIENADKVLTFGSSTGIEATFAGKVSILAGKTLYRGLGSTYEPKSHDELMGMLRNATQPCDKEGALIYGFYYSTLGKPFQHYQADDLANGAFKGVRLTAEMNGFQKIRHWFFLNISVSERIRQKLRSRRRKHIKGEADV